MARARLEDNYLIVPAQENSAMKSFRKVLRSSDDSFTVELPPELRGRHIEVVVTLIMDGDSANSIWPDGFFQRIAGQWSGAPLERPPQSEFETRRSFN
jgi:hypothetical protein